MSSSQTKTTCPKCGDEGFSTHEKGLCPDCCDYCEDCEILMDEEKDVEWNCPSCDKGYCLDCSYTSIQCEEGEYEGQSLCSVCYEEECEKSEQKKCCDCERTEDMLDANDIELEEAGKYSRCLDCKDERISNMKMGCMNCGDKVGRHALFVGKIGYNICEPCDIATEIK